MRGHQPLLCRFMGFDLRVWGVCSVFDPVYQPLQVFIPVFAQIGSGLVWSSFQGGFRRFPEVPGQLGIPLLLKRLQTMKHLGI